MSEICFKIIGGKWKGYRWNKIGYILIMAGAGWWICQGLLHYAVYVWKSPQIVWGLSWWSSGWASVGLPRWLSDKESACQCKEMQEMQFWSLGRGIPPEGGNVNPLQYSCLRTAMGRGAWWATVHRVTKSQTWLSDWAWTHTSNARGISSVPGWETNNSPLWEVKKKKVLNVIQIRHLN